MQRVCTLQDPIDEESQRVVLSAFFGTTIDAVRLGAHHDYLQYYERELRSLRIGIMRSSWAISSLAAKTHEQIAQICRVLADSKSLPRKDIRQKIRVGLFPDDEDLSIQRSIDLTVRLWLMINVRDDELSLQMPFKTSIQWEDDCSLENLIEGQFPRSTEPVQQQRRLALRLRQLTW